MIPILYRQEEDGQIPEIVARLVDCISCVVSEERNGEYELEIEYPITGMHYSDIQIGMKIEVLPYRGATPQLFDIYAIRRPINGIVTINCEHISYRLAKTPCYFLYFENLSQLMNQINQMAEPFSLSTDITSSLKLSEYWLADTVRNRMMGTQESITAVWGGEWEFDNYNLYLHRNRGEDRGVTFRYGKNITSYEYEEDISDFYNIVQGFWKAQEPQGAYGANIVYSDEVRASSGLKIAYDRTLLVDYTSEFQKEPTRAQLTQMAREYISSHNIGVPKISIDVSFINLADTEEYKHIAQLEDVRPWDIITIILDEFGLKVKAKIVKYEFDVIRERFNSISIGYPKINYTQNITNKLQDNQRKIETNASLINGIINS